MFASSIRALLCSVTELIFLSLIEIIRSFISKPTSAAILCELIAVILGITLYCSPWFKNNNKKKANIKLIKGPANTISDLLNKEMFSNKFKMYDFTILNNNKVIYHYHFKNLKDINKLIQKYK